MTTIDAERIDIDLTEALVEFTNHLESKAFIDGELWDGRGFWIYDTAAEDFHNWITTLGH